MLEDDFLSRFSPLQLTLFFKYLFLKLFRNYKIFCLFLEVRSLLELNIAVVTDKAAKLHLEMERVQSMFSNVFGTPAGQLVEKATASSLPSEDWALNIEVCDAVKAYADGPKDAVKAIKRRLSSNKNFNQICLTLSLLESCVKNCGVRFHVLVTSREFIHDTLLKLIQPKNNPSIILQQRVFGMIKQYAEAFGSHPHMTGVLQVYEELQAKGVEFPETNPLGVIGTGEPEASRSGGPGQRETSHVGKARNRSNGQQGQSYGRYVANPSPQQIAKIRKDISVVDGNIKVFSEMLTELNPSSCDPGDTELMQELNRTCRAMQQRVVELLEQVGSEEITVELLRVNDDLNNIFLRYERFERFRKNKGSAETRDEQQTFASPAQHSGSAYPPAFPQPHATLSVVEEPPPSYSDTEQPTPEVSDLIDLSGDAKPTATASSSQQIPTALTNDLAGLSLSAPGPSEQPQQKSLSEQLDAFGDVPDRELMRLESTENEIEQWLSSAGQQTGGVQPVNKGETVTDEFSAFLNERATAAATLPTLPHSSTQGGGNPF